LLSAASIPLEDESLASLRAQPTSSARATAKDASEWGDLHLASTPSSNSAGDQQPNIFDLTPDETAKLASRSAVASKANAAIMASTVSTSPAASMTSAALARNVVAASDDHDLDSLALDVAAINLKDDDVDNGWLDGDIDLNSEV